jgi:hypothetical protein
MTALTHTVPLQRVFAERHPRVVASFGGADHLFSRWWEDIRLLEPRDTEFIARYSTNDWFLQNRLVLPEEVPLLVLPILRHIVRKQYERVVFIERSARPWMFATRELLRVLGRTDIEVTSIRVKALARESLSANVLSVAAERPVDLAWLIDEATRAECAAVGCSEHRGSRADLVARLAGTASDPRISIPGALKAVVFIAGSLSLEGPVSAKRLREGFEAQCRELSPVAVAAADAMIRQATSDSEPVRLGLLLDAMNVAVRNLRGSMRHAGHLSLRALLGSTATAQWFADRRTLFVDELSVCGGSCFAIEVVGRSFCREFRPQFASIVDMTAEESFLDAAAGDFFEFKPLEDVPWLSPDRFEPVFTHKERIALRLHRFPTCRAVGQVPAWWRRVSWHDRALKLQPGAQSACGDWETALSAWLTSELPWDQFPVLRRRAASLPDLGATLLVYYLGCLTPGDETVVFDYDSLLEARLESALGFCGRLQKPFFAECDRLLGWFMASERVHRDLFLGWRRDMNRYRPAIDAEITRRVCDEHSKYEQRMLGGVDAVKAQWPDVLRFLSGEGDGARRSTGFRRLFESLQRAVP